MPDKVHRELVRRAERRRQTLTAYVRIRLSRHEHLPFARRILELRDNFTVYDASYVALAESPNAPLLTADSPLISAVLSHTSVEAIEVTG